MWRCVCGPIITLHIKLRAVIERIPLKCWWLKDFVEVMEKRWWILINWLNNSLLLSGDQHVARFTHSSPSDTVMGSKARQLWEKNLIKELLQRAFLLWRGWMMGRVELQCVCLSVCCLSSRPECLCSAIMFYSLTVQLCLCHKRMNTKQLWQKTYS